MNVGEETPEGGGDEAEVVTHPVNKLSANRQPAAATAKRVDNIITPSLLFEETVKFELLYSML